MVAVSFDSSLYEAMLPGRMRGMNVIIDQQFRDLIKAEIEKQGITRSELARRMGVLPGYVTDYLNGHKAPGPDVMEKFFAALNVTPRLVLDTREEKLQTVG